MIHDIKVFNPEGELLEVINGQEVVDAKYLAIAKSLSKTMWGKHCKPVKKRSIFCSICKIKTEARANQLTCGSDKCVRQQQHLRRKSRLTPASLRKFKCPECGVKIETNHHSKKICGLQECLTKNRIKGEKLRIKKLKEKEYG